MAALDDAAHKVISAVFGDPALGFVADAPAPFNVPQYISAAHWQLDCCRGVNDFHF
jgi:hypothetical protein